MNSGVGAARDGSCHEWSVEWLGFYRLHDAVLNQ